MKHELHNRIAAAFAVLLAVSPGIAPAGERDAKANSPPLELVPLLENLDHSDFAVREEASRRLLDAGAQAIPALTEGVLASSPEAATRLLHVLEAHLLSGDPAVYGPADDALMRLADGDQGFVALRATDILSRHRSLREQRAVAAIRELGGTVRYGLDGQDVRNFGVGPVRSPHGQVPWPALRPTEIVIGSDWRGGTDGLKYLRHLSHWPGLILYVVRGTEVSLADAEKLAASMPGLMVHERGEAYLGIGNQPVFDLDTCVVGKVIDNGPAGRAGLREGDIIRALDGRPVGKFDDLIELLKDHSAGERVPITIERQSFRQWERLTLEVELGKWRLPDYTDDALEAIHRAKALQSSRDVKPLDPRDEPAPAVVFPPAER